MNRFLAVVLSCILSAIWVLWAYAWEVPSGLLVDWVTDSSIQVSWNTDDTTLGYRVYYSEESGLYDNQLNELIEGSSAIIEELDAQTTYYVSVVSVDEFGFESEYSPEIMATTDVGMGNTESWLSLVGVDVLSFSEIELEFNKNLDSDPDVNSEFKIVNKANSLDELFVIKSQVNAENTTQLFLTFDREALPGSEYELTAIDAKSISGDGIESWIDGVISFSVPEAFATEEDIVAAEGIDLSVSSSSEPLSENSDEAPLHSAAEDDTHAVVSWQSLTEADIINNTISESKKAEVLPTAWPAHLFLFLLTFLFATLIFVLRFKKRS